MPELMLHDLRKDGRTVEHERQCQANERDHLRLAILRTAGHGLNEQAGLIDIDKVSVGNNKTSVFDSNSAWVIKQS